MTNYRNPKYLERYEDVVYELDTALNLNVANNASQKKEGYRFVADNSGETTPLDWYHARFNVDFKLVLMANGGNIAVNVWRAICSKITFRHITTYYDTCICRKDMKQVEIGRNGSK